MKKTWILWLLTVLAWVTPLLADRVLEPAEIDSILQQLTSSSSGRTWISEGVIEAIHEEYEAAKTLDEGHIFQQIEQARQEYIAKPDKHELDGDLQKMKLDAIPFNVRYKLSNESKMTTKEVVRYNGSHFYWQIDVLSRTDTVKPPLDESFMYEFFNLDWNQKRIFSWDGNRYVQYSEPVGNAIIAEGSANTLPTVVNGPLTAGYIPWGYGNLAYAKMTSDAAISATEVTANGVTEIHLNLTYPEGYEYSFVLDAGKGYAAKTEIIDLPGRPTWIYTYDGFQEVGNRWIPRLITLDRFSTNETPSRLIHSEVWRITSIQSGMLAADAFAVPIAADATVQYHSPQSEKPLIYQHSEPNDDNNQVDSDSLLNLRLEALQSSSAKNCATLAMKYVAPKMGASVTDSQLASLINPVDGKTSLFALQQFATGLGLYTKAVTTDLETLKSLAREYQVIVYLPGSGHFAAVGNVDGKFIRLVDLTKNYFYYSIPLTQFHLDWEGTALLLSPQPFAAPAGTTEMDAAGQQAILGAACTTGHYSCSTMVQEENTVFCEVTCMGLYEYWYERWTCACDTVGSCSNGVMIRYSTSPCLEDPQIQGNCIITGIWTNYNMRACM